MANPQPTDSHLRIAHSIQEEIMMRDFSKRQRSILDLILRLSWGCGKTMAIIPKQKDFELVGISETKIKSELKWLINARVIAWDKDTTGFSFNKNYDQWKVSIVPGYDKERLAALIHLNIPGTSQNSKNTSQNGNFPNWEELPEKASINFPKREVSEPATPSVTGPEEVSIKSIIESNKEYSASKDEINTFFESIWRLYPNKKGKGQVSDTQKKKLYKIGFEHIKRAIDRYVQVKEKEPWRQYQNGSTFFNSGHVDYLDENYHEEITAPTAGTSSGGRQVKDEGVYILA